MSGIENGCPGSTSALLKNDAVWMPGNAAGMAATTPKVRPQVSSSSAPARFASRLACSASSCPKPMMRASTRYGSTVICIRRM